LVSALGRPCRLRPISGTGGILTASEYLFAAAMTVVIVWLVAELGQNALKP
jgi:hypothetical protein